jgi:hypothetical protein
MSGVKALLKSKKGKKTPTKEKEMSASKDIGDMDLVDMGGLSDDDVQEPKEDKFEFPFKRRKTEEPSSESDNDVQEIKGNGKVLK